MIINAVTDFDDSIQPGSLKSVSYTIRVPSVANYPEEAVTPARYVVRLYHAPYLANQTLYPITITGLSKVSTAPAAGEFRVVDSILRARPHLLEFNVAEAGDTYTVSYYALTSVLDYQFIGNITSGYGVSVPMYVLNARDHGTNLTNSIADLPAGDKVVFLKNGDYKITTQLSFATNSILELIGESTEGVILTCTLAGQNQIIIGDKIIKNITVNSSVSNGYGVIVSNAGLIYSTQKIENIHLISDTNIGYGFTQCTNIIGCYAEGFSSGFHDCTQLINCYATLNTYGFNTSSSITNCTGYGNVEFDFKSSFYLNACKSANAGIVGIQTCQKVSHCQVINAGTYGYQNCRGLSNNVSSGAGTQNYDQTVGNVNYASHAVNATYVINNANGVDTPNGGFNT
jgi:hypothetical protein